ncbi:MAG: transposase, partial [Deltaproteobacteria bacterium]|nr:transposase [Deltaproteobacteria bacterium]
ITTDEAYHDKDGSLYKESGVHLVKPPNSKVNLPANVDAKTLQVMLDDFCDIPMKYIGIEDDGHEFKCDVESGQCHRSELCPKYRHIPFDNGCFQRILYGSDAVAKALDIRKNGERPFNLLKKREGLEQVRVRSQHGLVARSTFTTMATLLIELAGTRKTKKTKQKQMKLPLAV